MYRWLPVVGSLMLAGVLASCANHNDGPQVATADTAGRTPTATTNLAEQTRRYVSCMRKHGVVMIEDPHGPPQVDKDHTTFAVVDAATRVCGPQPTQTTSTGVPAEALQRARQFAACMREHGVAQYPDPDPRTGESDVLGALGAEAKSDPILRQALTSCAPKSHDPGTVGG